MSSARDSIASEVAHVLHGRAERMVPGVASEKTSREHIARYEWAAKFVSGKRVLDVACGAGYGSRILRSAGASSVVGVDLAEETIAYARSQYGGESIEFRAADAQELNDFEAGSFDLVVSFETIEHLPKPERFLTAVSRVLAHDGVFLCSTPDARFSLLGRLRGRPTNPHHIREYTGRQFRALLSRYFDVVAMNGQQQVPWMISLWPIQASLKCSARILRFPAWSDRVARWYSVDGGNCEVIENVPRWRVPQFWIAHCRNCKLEQAEDTSGTAS